MVSGKFFQLNLRYGMYNKFILFNFIVLHTQVIKGALDDFEPGRGIPKCVLKARPLCEDFPELLHQVILNGIKPPHHKILLSYMPLRNDRGTGSQSIMMAIILL